MKILVTGVAGFIGMHVAKILLERGDYVVGVDNINDYYDVNLKLGRISVLKLHNNFNFIKDDICNVASMESIFQLNQFNRVINLAGQPGVRYSLENPSTYVQSNLVGFANILELCKKYMVEHLVYASSSSVYGANTSSPFAVDQNTSHPLNLYAATKKANELMAHSYSHVYKLPTTGLRYFSVYGPWGRPDMSAWLFTSAILNNEVINIFNMGNMLRDFTYIKDIAEATVKVVDKIAQPSDLFNTFHPNPSISNAPYKIYNVGRSESIKLMDFIEMLEEALGKKAKKNFMPMQSGDAIQTYANLGDLETEINYILETNIKSGIDKWIQWYLAYQKI